MIRLFFQKLAADHKEIYSSIMGEKRKRRREIEAHVLEIEKFLDFGAPSHYEFPGCLSRFVVLCSLRDLFCDNKIYVEECKDSGGFRVILEHKGPSVSSFLRVENE